MLAKIKIMDYIKNSGVIFFKPKLLAAKHGEIQTPVVLGPY